MPDISALEFCERHHACGPGRDWVLVARPTMTDVWADARSEWLIWVATRPDVLLQRELVRFSLFCLEDTYPRLEGLHAEIRRDIEEVEKGRMTSIECRRARMDKVHYLQDEEDKKQKVDGKSYFVSYSPAMVIVHHLYNCLLRGPDANAHAAAAAGAALDAWGREEERSACEDRQAAWLRKNCSPFFGVGPVVSSYCFATRY